MAATRINNWKAIASRGKRIMAMSAGIALALVLVAGLAIQGNSASASSQMASGLGVLEACAVSADFNTRNDSPGLWRQGANAMTAAWPDAPTPAASPVSNPEQPASPAKSVYVWAAFMIVGTATDDDTTYAGYIPGVTTGNEGTLTHTTFAYGGIDYQINGLFHRQTNGATHHLVFQVDKTLPQYLTLNVGNLELPVRESSVGGPNRNIYTWRLDTGPGWAENQRIVAALTEQYVPQRALAEAPVCE